MNKELEEAIKNLNKFAYTMYGTLSVKEAKVILNYIENSIPKEKVEEKIEETTKRYNEIHTKHLRDCGIAEQRALAQREVLEELLDGK